MIEYIDNKIYEDSIIELETKLSQYKIYYDIMTKWLKNNFNNKSIYYYLKKENINVIAIYGMGNLGQILYNELKKKIKIEFTIDNSLDGDKINNYKSITLQEVNTNILIDAIIITPIYASESIKEDLKLLYKGKDINILTIDKVVNDIYKEKL